VYLESRSCFTHCSSRCCKNISAIILDIGEPFVVGISFFGRCNSSVMV
jgi:hypothetical protein